MKRFFLGVLAIFLAASINANDGSKSKKTTKVFIIGDSTVADYSLENNYKTAKYPITGWGQVFQSFFRKDSLKQLNGLIKTDSVIVDDRAKGGRSTRTFFQEGRWHKVYDDLKPGDLMLMQFGHNDAAENKPERYVNIQGYKEFLRLFVSQTRQKGGIPILITPVNRNYPWENGVLKNCHGEYPQAVKDVAMEMNVLQIDLTTLSSQFFTKKGEEYVGKNYFMHLPAGVYTAYPTGQNDNTHFQPEGAKAVAQLVFDGMKSLKSKK